MSNLRVFISYAHDSDEHSDLVLALAQRLRRDGLHCEIDQFQNGTPTYGWTQWMEAELRGADRVLVVGSEAYVRRYDIKETEGGRGATWEGAIIRRALYNSYGDIRRYVPVLFGGAASDLLLPEPLRDATVYRLDRDYIKLLRVLTNQPPVVPAPIGRVPRLSAGDTSEARLPILSTALAAGFKDAPEALRHLAEDYGPDELPALANESSLEVAARRFVESAYAAGPGMLESVMRCARRRRPKCASLAHAINDAWPLANDLTLPLIDELASLLQRAAVSHRDVQQVALSILGDERPPMWRGYGPEKLEDLLEGLAQLRPTPPRLALVAQRYLHIAGVPEWVEHVAPEVALVMTGQVRQRLLLLLRQGVNDRYTGEVYIADAAGKPRFITALGDQVPLADIPDQFMAAQAANEDLQNALLGAPLELIEVMLPVRELGAPIETWDLFGSGPIGESYPVVVRPLERAFPKQYAKYFGGAMSLPNSWRRVQGTPVIRHVQLEREHVNEAVRHHPDAWCVAAFRVAETIGGERLEAIDQLIKRGVAAMLMSRHNEEWPPRIIDKPNPAAVREHRCENPRHPLMLLWDDADFIPGKKSK